MSTLRVHLNPTDYTGHMRDTIKDEIQYEGNEKGLEIIVKASQQASNEGAGLHASIDDLSFKELRTILYALDFYKNDLIKSGSDENASPTTLIENQAFCLQEAGKIAMLQFELLYNYDSKVKVKFLQDWLDML